MVRGVTALLPPANIKRRSEFIRIALEFLPRHARERSGAWRIEFAR
jgi:hypothetical protein